MIKMNITMTEQKLRFIMNQCYDIGANNEPSSAFKAFTKELIIKFKENQK